MFNGVLQGIVTTNSQFTKEFSYTQGTMHSAINYIFGDQNNEKCYHY